MKFRDYTFDADNPYESPEKYSRSVPTPVARAIGIGDYLLIVVVALTSGCIAFFVTCFTLGNIANSGYLSIDPGTGLLGSFVVLIIVSIFVGLKMYESFSKGPADPIGNKS